MLKSSSAGGCLGVPLRVGLSAASPRYAVGFPLQSLTWMKGLSLSCTCTLASVSDHFGRLHGRSRTSGGRTNGTHPSVPSHGASAVRRNLPCPVSPERIPRRLSGSRNLTVLPYTSPARISLPWETGVPGSPEGFFFLHPASNLPLTEMTDRAFFP